MAGAGGVESPRAFAGKETKRLEFLDRILPTRRRVKKLRKALRRIDKRLDSLAPVNRTHRYTLFSMSQALVDVGPETVCIDCGAHQGLISEVFLRLGAEVYAFEANPDLYNATRFRLSEWVERGRLHPIHRAVWDREESINLFMRDDYTADTLLGSASESSSMLVEKTRDGVDYRTSADRYVEVMSVDLCKFIESLDREIHILKMDVEGVEFDILLKLIESGLYERVRHIFVETHDHKIPELGEKARRTRELIEEHGISNIDLEWH